MSLSSTLRRAGAAAAAAFVLVGTATPAHAGSSYLSRTTGRAAWTEWVQVLDLRSRGFGNVHIGYLSAFETSAGVADVFAWIDDFDCPDGQLPGGGHDDPSGCQYVGARLLEGSGVSFTISGRLDRAHLEGTLLASTAGHEGPGDPVGTVTANFDWIGTGDVVRSTSTFRYRDGDTSYSETYRSTRRAATMQGVLGPMLFEEAASSSGAIEEFRTKTQWRQK